MSGSSSDWITWLGGNCPVADETVIDTKQRGGNICLGFRADDVRGLLGHWGRAGHERLNDIVAYRLAALTKAQPKDKIAS